MPSFTLPQGSNGMNRTRMPWKTMEAGRGSGVMQSTASGGRLRYEVCRSWTAKRLRYNICVCCEFGQSKP